MIFVPVREIATCIVPRRRGRGRLWQGGIERFEGHAPCRVRVADVDAVVLLECDLGVDVTAPRVRRLPLIDDGADLQYLPELHKVAAEMAGVMVDGGDVVTLCRQGRNRSGLVSGLILYELGMGGPEAVRLIRSKRKRRSLSTPEFAAYLRSLVG